MQRKLLAVQQMSSGCVLSQIKGFGIFGAKLHHDSLFLDYQ